MLNVCDFHTHLCSQVTAGMSAKVRTVWLSHFPHINACTDSCGVRNGCSPTGMILLGTHLIIDILKIIVQQQTDKQ